MSFFNRRIAAVAILSLGGGLGLPQPANAQDVPYLGQIMYVGYTFCPRGWAEASGQLLSISSNAALFSLLGTTYGGDGRTTFQLPDLRGRVPVHAGTGPGLSNVSLGETGGAESRMLSFAQMPAHSHTASTSVDNLQVTSVLRASTTNANADSPAGASLAVPKKEAYFSGPPDSDMAVGSVESSVTGGSAETTVDSTNSGTDSVPLRDPYLGIRACIALEGIYPSRP
jgi:microcystin-dependent protein